MAATGSKIIVVKGPLFSQNVKAAQAFLGRRVVDLYGSGAGGVEGEARQRETVAGGRSGR